MKTVKDVKQRLIDQLMNMDMNRMSLIELEAYTRIVGNLAAMDKPDYMESLARYAAGGFSGAGVSVTDGKECK